MSKDGINSKDFLIGTLIGGIIGATTALFLAPKSGRELREDINQQAHVVKDKTSKLTNDAYEKGTQFISIAKEKTTNASQVITDQSSQLLNKVKELRPNVAEEEQDFVEEATEEPASENEEEVTTSEVEEPIKTYN
ncbi:YtxH domain-containing protein [Bacillus kexueae]|uniref:YtxH domain-containing protein n=1 Tax=Aeribacillus kexueae TaxID=2078952 RepID=UPI001FB02F36|nr:YtxH domain-containing protein [Bacillus kexueae]